MSFEWTSAWLDIGELALIAASFPITPTRNTWRVWMDEEPLDDDEPLGPPPRIVFGELDWSFDWSSPHLVEQCIGRVLRDLHEQCMGSLPC